MVYVKLEHFQAGDMRVRPFVHDVFSSGLTYNFEINNWFLKNHAAYYIN